MDRVDQHKATDKVFVITASSLFSEFQPIYTAAVN